MINYGLPYRDNGTTASPIPAFTYTFDEQYSFDQSTNAVPEYIWKPSIRVREVVDRIFARTDYTIISDFFDTDYFKSMYMDTFQNGQLGVTVASGVSNQNIFKVYMRPSTVITFGSAGARPLNMQTFRGDGYDPLGNFVLGAGVTNSIDPPNPSNATNYFRVPFAGNYGWNFRFNYDDNNVVGGDIYFQIYARKSSDLATLDIAPPFAVSDLYNLPTSGAELPVNWFFSGNCGTGEFVRLYIDLKSSSTPGKQLRLLPYNEYTITSEAPMWDLYATPTLFQPQNVDIRLGLQQINCIDFLKAMITLFNLVVVQDEVSQSIIIEPFNWYYNEEDRIEKDWTQRLDLNSTYRIEPLSFDLPKELNFTYTKGSEEYLNKLFEDTNTQQSV